MDRATVSLINLLLSIFLVVINSIFTLNYKEVNVFKFHKKQNSKCQLIKVNWLHPLKIQTV